LAGKGLPIIVEQVGRQPELAERSLHDVAYAACVHPRHGLTPQQIPAMRIRDRQRVAPTPIPAAEPTLEIDTPHLVGGLRMTQWIQAWTHSAVTLWRHRHAFSFEQFTDRAGC